MPSFFTSAAYVWRPLWFSCSSSCNAAMNQRRIRWSGSGSSRASSTVEQSAWMASQAPQLHGYPRHAAHSLPRAVLHVLLHEDEAVEVVQKRVVARLRAVRGVVRENDREVERDDVELHVDDVAARAGPALASLAAPPVAPAPTSSISSFFRFSPARYRA